MVNLSEIKERCAQVYQEAEKLLIEVGYREMGQICIVSPGETVESRTLYYALMEYIKALDMASIYMDQVCADEVEQGVIHKNDDGSYIFNGNELEAGDVVQVYNDDMEIWEILMLDDCFEPGNRRLVLREKPEIELGGLEIRHAKTGWS